MHEVNLRLSNINFTYAIKYIFVKGYVNYNCLFAVAWITIDLVDVCGQYRLILSNVLSFRIEYDNISILGKMIIHDKRLFSFFHDS